MLSTASSNISLAPYLIWPPGRDDLPDRAAFTYLGDGVRRGMLRSRSAANSEGE